MKDHPDAGWRNKASSALTWLMIAHFTNDLYVNYLPALPFLYRARGKPVTEGAAAMTAMILSGAFGGMIAGYLSDRYGRRLVLFVSFVLATPLFLAAIMSTGTATIIFLAPGGGALFGSSS